MSIEFFFSIASLVLSIISVIAAVIAVRYTRHQAEYARKQYELTKTEFDLQIQTQQFTMKPMDSYYHLYEDESFQKEFLGAIIGIDNPTQSSVFIRFLNIKFNVREQEKVKFRLPLWKQWIYERGYGQLTISHPSFDLKEMSLVGAVPSNISAGDTPTTWIFDRRTDKLINFSNPIEIPQGTDTILWEFIAHTPASLWKKIENDNMEFYSMTLRAILHDQRVIDIEVVFDSRLGLESSNRERVMKLIATSNQMGIIA